MNESLAGIFELIQEEENGLEEEEAEEGEDPGDMFNLDAGRKFLFNYNYLANSLFHNPFNCDDPQKQAARSSPPLDQGSSPLASTSPGCPPFTQLWSVS